MWTVSCGTGARTRAVRRLSTKDDRTLAEVGETCERVPASSLPGLLTIGAIELIVEEGECNGR